MEEQGAGLNLAFNGRKKKKSLKCLAAWFCVFWGKGGNLF